MSLVMIRNKCNQRCVYCNNPNLIENGTFKETSHQEIMQQISNSKGEVLFSGGGEPTLFKNLPYYIHLAKKRYKCCVGLETNGMVLSYYKYAEKLKHSGLDYCVISLHGCNETISDSITQTPGSHRLTIKGISNLKKAKIPLVGVLHTLCGPNYTTFPSFIRLMQELHICSVGLSFIRPIAGDTKSESITPKFQSVKPHLRTGLSLATGKIGVRFSAGLWVPPCMLPDQINRFDEIKVFIEGGKNQHMEQSHYQDRIKPSECRGCSLGICCSGVQKSYACLHGTIELHRQHISFECIKKRFADPNISKP